MQESKTDLSIIIPFFKGGQFLPRLISSLMNSLEHSGNSISIEIIVIIDSPETEISQIRTIVESLTRQNEKVVLSILKNEKNLGVSMSRNKGKSVSTGRFTTFIDQDDYVDEEYFQVLKQNLSEKYDFFLLNGTLIYEQNGFKRLIFLYRYRLSFGIIAKSNFLITPGIIVFKRTSVYHDFRQVSPKHPGSDDWAFYLELLAGGRKKYKFIMKPVFYYVVHEHNFHHAKLNFLLSQLHTIQYFTKRYPDNINLRLKQNSLKFRLKLNLSLLSLKSLSLADVAGFLSLVWIELTSFNNILWLFLQRRSKRQAG